MRLGAALPVLAAAAGMAGCRAAAPAAAPPAVPIRFVDVTERAGIRFRHSHGGTGKKYFVETSGSGACFFDYDDDGDPDLYVVQSGPLPGSAGFGGEGNRSALYRNDGGGRFTDVTAAAGVGNHAYGQGCCAGDFDGDGRLDLFVTNFGANRLYRNNGDGTFSDVTQKAGVAAPAYNTGAAFADVDGDGWLDLFVARYAKYRIGMDPRCSQAPGLHSYCPPAQFDGEPDVLFRNNGDGTFTDVTAGSGIDDARGKGLGVLFTDVNDDGRPDLYVANDGTLNRLYENLGTLGGRPRFKDITAASGTGMGEGGRLSAGMGVDAADCDGDGRLDLFVTNFTGEPNDLYRSAGGGVFDIRSTPSGLGGPSMPYTGFGTAFLDYDLDGLPDVAVANGHVADDIEKAVPGITYAQPAALFRNLGGGMFADVSANSGPDLVRPRVGRGLAAADVDGDGDTDLFLNNSGSAAALLANAGGTGRGWIRLRLRGPAPNRFAVGARVILDADGRTQVREVRTGGSYLSQNEFVLGFGIGGARAVDRVRVRWPSGRIQEWRGLAAGREHLLEQGR